MPKKETENAVPDIYKLAELLILKKLAAEELTSEERRAILDSRIDPNDAAHEIRRLAAKLQIADLEQDFDSASRRSSAIGTAMAAAPSAADFAEKRTNQRTQNRLNSKKPRKGDALARLVGRVVNALGLSKNRSRPAIVIGQLGKHDTENILRPYRERSEYGVLLNPKKVEHYFNCDHVHWINGNGQSMRTKTSGIATRVRNARGKVNKKST